MQIIKNIIFVNFKINHPSQKLINSLNYKKASLKEMSFNSYTMRYK